MLNSKVLEISPEPAIEKEPLIRKANPVTNSKKKVFINTVSFGVNGLFLALYNVSNGKLISMLGDEKSGAAAVVSMYQSVIMGGCIGLLFSTGLELGKYIGERKYTEAGKTAKASWLLATGLGVLSSATMLSTRLYFPYIFEAETSKAAIDFFTTCSLGNIQQLMLVVNAQIAFQEGDWIVPPIIGLSLCSSSIALGYALAFIAKLGPLGIGYGSSIAQTVVFLASQAWFLRSDYHKYQLFTLTKLSELTQKITSMLKMGWKISIQRLNEWVNLMLITTLIGIENNNTLKATAPGVEYVRIFATVMQGIAQAVGMLIRQNKAVMKVAKEENNIVHLRAIHRNNRNIIIQSNLTGVLINSIFAGLFYLERKPLAKFFLADISDEHTEELAQTLLWINMIGLIPDAVRLISTGAARGWEDVFYPAMISLLIMIVMGVPLGWGLGKLIHGDSDLEGNAALLFYTRHVATFITSLLMLARCKKLLDQDSLQIAAIPASQDDAQPDPVPKKGSSHPVTLFFKKSNTSLNGEHISVPEDEVLKP